MTIKNIYLYNLRNAEHGQFINDVLTLVDEATPAALRVEEQAAALAAAFAREDEAVKKIAKSALTAELVEANRTRDRIFRGLVGTVRTSLNHFLPEMETPARQAAIVLDTYGDLTKKPAAEKTADIYKLVQELQTRYPDCVAALGLGAWLTALQKANSAAEKLMNERYEESSGRTDLVTEVVRVEVDEAYKALVTSINALWVMERGELCAEFIRTLNAIIERAQTVMAIRRGKAKAEREKKTAEEEAAKAADDVIES